MMFGKQLAAFGHAAAAQLREPLKHQSRGFATGVRVKNADTLHQVTCGWRTSTE
jgi:hypothetical protein